jgi:hypothetical protein
MLEGRCHDQLRLAQVLFMIFLDRSDGLVGRIIMGRGATDLGCHGDHEPFVPILRLLDNGHGHLSDSFFFVRAALFQVIDELLG